MIFALSHDVMEPHSPNEMYDILCIVCIVDPKRYHKSRPSPRTLCTFPHAIHSGSVVSCEDAFSR